MLISKGRVMRAGSDPHDPPVADILIEGNRIAAVGPNLRETMAETIQGDIQVVDASNSLVVPGFVNAHYHSHDVLAKGCIEEAPLETWRLLALPPQYPKRSREEIRARTLLGAIECLRSGMTSIQDMVTLFPFDPEHLDIVAEAYRDVGIRAVVALQYADIRGVDTVPFWRKCFPEEMHKFLSSAAEPDKNSDQLAYMEEKYLKGGTGHDRLTWALGPSAPERCTPELIERTIDLSQRYGMSIYTHIYESKGMALQARQEYQEFDGSLVKRLHKEGMLGPRLNLAHSVWLLPEEIELLAETNTNVVINPLSNMKLKSGIPPILQLQEAGITMGLGCDNCSCSDAQNMFQAMKLYCLIAAISDPDPGPDQAVNAFNAATVGGASTAGLGNELGVIEPGYLADLVLLNLKDPSFVPLNSAVRQLVYTEGGRGIQSVIVNGEIVIRDGVLKAMDEEAIIQEVMEIMPEFMKDYCQVAERAERLKPFIEKAHKRIWAEDVGMNRMFTGQ